MHKLLSQLQATLSINQKKQVLKQYENHEGVKEVLRYTLNPFIRYHITLDDTPDSVNSMFDDTFWAEWDKGYIQLGLEELSTGGSTSTKAELIEHLIDDPVLAPIIGRIIAHDLRCGVGPKIVNDVFKKLIPQFSVMLAKVLDVQVDFPTYVNSKLDGLRCVAVVQDGEVLMHSRKGLVLTGLSVIKKELESLKLENVVFDGELYLHKSEFDKISGAIRKHKECVDIEYHIFDMLPLTDFLNKKGTQTLEQRLEAMSNMKLAECPHLTIVRYLYCHSQVLLNSLYENALEHGYEGLMIKDPTAHYEFKRSSAWLKMKPVGMKKGTIIGKVEGAGKYKNSLGAFVVDMDGVEVRVGSGFSDMDRNLFWTMEDIIGKDAYVKYQGLTHTGSLRFPRFAKLANDLK